MPNGIRFERPIDPSLACPLVRAIVEAKQLHQPTTTRRKHVLDLVKQHHVALALGQHPLAQPVGGEAPLSAQGLAFVVGIADFKYLKPGGFGDQPRKLGLAYPGLTVQKDVQTLHLLRGGLLQQRLEKIEIGPQMAEVLSLKLRRRCRAEKTFKERLWLGIRLDPSNPGLSLGNLS